MNAADPPMRLIARLLFYPTLWWNVFLNLFIEERHWWDWVDETVLIGALPAASDVAKLRAEGIGAVVNTCREHLGPVAQYAEAGIEQLHVPITDFTAPDLQQVCESVDFIHKHAAAGRKVYVHCKAGRGRSATIVICYLIAKGMSAQDAQALLQRKRPHVLADVFRRAVVSEYQAKLSQKIQ